MLARGHLVVAVACSSRRSTSDSRWVASQLTRARLLHSPVLPLIRGRAHSGALRNQCPRGVTVPIGEVWEGARLVARRCSASPMARREIEIRLGTFDAEAATSAGEAWPSRRSLHAELPRSG